MKLNFVHFILCMPLAISVAVADSPRAIRIGHFPNVTHAQALLARADASFERMLGVPIEWTSFNAGPSAIEALFAGAVDATYVGPNPAINGFVKSKGQNFQIVAGAASGGAALVVRVGSGIESEADFHGKVVATPQIGNTQDVATRAWLRDHGYTLRERGGTVTVIPLANPDQLLMFQRREIDAAWTVEPWVSRLEQEANGRVLFDESVLWPNRRYVTAVLVVSRSFIQKYPELVEKLIAAHVALTDRLEKNKDAVAPTINEQIKNLTGKALPPGVLASALRRVEFTWDPLEAELQHAADLAHEIGFLREKPDLTGLFNLDFLTSVLKQRHKEGP